MNKGPSTRNGTWVLKGRYWVLAIRSWPVGDAHFPQKDDQPEAPPELDIRTRSRCAQNRTLADLRKTGLCSSVRQIFQSGLAALNGLYPRKS